MGRVLKAGLVIAAIAAAGSLATIHPVCCAASGVQTRATASVEGRVLDAQGGSIPGARVSIWQGGRNVLSVVSAANGAFTLPKVAPGSYELRVEMSGFTTVIRPITIATGTAIVRLPPVTLSVAAANESKTSGAGRGGRSGSLGGPADAVTVAGEQALIQASAAERVESLPTRSASTAPLPAAMPGPSSGQAYRQDSYVYIPPPGRGEGYARVPSNRFRRTSDEPLSTFGADVDTASYANARRFLRNGQLPPIEAVRVEEFINYFRFDYNTPRSNHPIGVTTEVGDAPWNPRHKLVLIGARAVAPGHREIAGRNIVLLIDVSGSMSSPDKLALLKSAFGVFVDTLQPSDLISIVTYAGASGVALPPTRARDRARILGAIEGLGAGGSTNGAGGITTAYRLARESFIEGGVNRVILATDGDFNVGVTSHDGLLRLIEREKESGVFLSVLGVGTGNLQDATMELLADKGNGHYSYLDSMQEARRVLVREAGSTLETVAKDVKFQVEFNPAEVSAWKLIGYENRLMAHEDFNDDRKDGGEVGAGHTVTVLYEIVPVGTAMGTEGDETRPVVDPLRYQSREDDRPRSAPPAPVRRGEWLTVKVRYQQPDGSTSRLITVPVAVAPVARPVHLPFAAAVAEYGLLLREQRSASVSRWNDLVERLESMPVPVGLRADRDQLVELATIARDLSKVR
jgi:Ca-activated chloride channel homolog